jgi:Mg-chelatase subunit ChlD
MTGRAIQTGFVVCFLIATLILHPANTVWAISLEDQIREQIDYVSNEETVPVHLPTYIKKKKPLPGNIVLGITRMLQPDEMRRYEELYSAASDYYALGKKEVIQAKSWLDEGKLSIAEQCLIRARGHLNLAQQNKWRSYELFKGTLASAEAKVEFAEDIVFTAAGALADAAGMPLLSRAVAAVHLAADVFIEARYSGMDAATMTLVHEILARVAAEIFGEAFKVDKHISQSVKELAKEIGLTRFEQSLAKEFARANLDMPVEEIARHLLDELYETFSDTARKSTVVSLASSTGDSWDSATMLAVDLSASMSERWQGGVKLDSAKRAASQIADMVGHENQAFHRSNRIGVVSFQTSADLVMPLTDETAGVRKALDSVSAEGNTNIGDGLEMALAGLSKARARHKFVLLLTDGKSNSGISNKEILERHVPRFQAASIRIYAIGFGNDGDLDKEFLQRLAASANGKYYYALNAWELQNVYVQIRHESMGSLIADFRGRVRQGETTSPFSFDVPRNCNAIHLTLNWPGSNLDVDLEDPKGRQVDSNYGGVSRSGQGKPVYLVIENPREGRWAARVKGLDVPEGTSDFLLLVSARESESKSPGWRRYSAIILISLALGLGLYWILMRKKKV